MGGVQGERSTYHSIRSDERNAAGSEARTARAEDAYILTLSSCVLGSNWSKFVRLPPAEVAGISVFNVELELSYTVPFGCTFFLLF